MNGDRDVTPERLAQLADGAAPRTEAERDAVALMAEVRGLADPAPDAVRRRIRAIASEETTGTAGRRRWLAGGDGRRRLALTAAPVAAAIVALAIAIPVAIRDDGGSAPPAAADAPAAARDGSAADAGGAAGAAAPAPQAAGPRAAVLVAPEAAASPEAAAAPEAAASSSATATATDALRAAEPQADASPGEDAAELDRAVARARATLERAGATGIETRATAGGTAATVVADVPADRVDAATEALEAQGARVTAGTARDAGTASVRATVTVTAGG